MSVPLFASSAPRGGRAQARPYLVQFKAGKMMRAGATVSSDRRKGYVYLYRGDDSLLHFAWRERDKTTAEDDFIVFPDDTEFARVPQCTTGRVYVFKLKGSGQKEFYWMQEPKEDNDDDLCRKVNATLNNTAGADDDEGSGSAMGSVSEQQVLQLLSQHGLELEGAGGDADRASPSELTAPGEDHEADIGRFLTEFARASSSGRAGAAAPPQRASDVDLRVIVTPDSMRTFLANEDVQRQLMPHLPESLRNPEELRGVLTTPQFQHALAAFNVALSRGELGPIMRQFGVSTSDADPTQGVEAFLRALQRQQRSEAADMEGVVVEEEEHGQDGNGARSEDGVDDK